MIGVSELIDGSNCYDIGISLPARLLVVNSHIQSLLPALVVSKGYVLVFILLFEEIAVGAAF